MVCGVGFAEERFPFALLLDAVVLLPDFAVAFELALGLVEELDFDVEGDLLFDDDAF